MLSSLSRRSFLNAAVCAGISAVAPTTVAAAGVSTTVASSRLDKGVTSFTGCGGNVVALAHDAGVLLVDGGLQEHSTELLRAIAAESGGRRIDTLLNTHWHWDHTGSNDALATAGATIIAHENTRLWLGTRINSQWEGKTYSPRQPAALPRRTFFYDSERLEIGGQVVEYGYLPQGHTDGDIYVWLPASNVLIGGGVVAGGHYPLVDYSTGGWIGGMIAALRTLIAKCDDQTRVIPGEGPPRTRADLTAQLEMCRTVASRIAASYFRGDTWEQFVASQPTREFDARWGNPDVFLRTAHASGWWHINEMRRGTF